MNYMERLSMTNNWETYEYMYNGENVTKKFNKVEVTWRNGTKEVFGVEWKVNYTTYGDCGHTYNASRYFLIIVIDYNGFSIKLNLHDYLESLVVIPIFE